MSIPKVDGKFQSGNSVPVERATITSGEWGEVRAERDVLAARIERLEDAIRFLLGNEPEYHPEGMGCGLEDRNITDRYEAMRYGWEHAVEAIYSEIMPSTELLDETPSQSLARVKAEAIKDMAAKVKTIDSFEYWCDIEPRIIAYAQRLIDEAGGE